MLQVERTEAGCRLIGIIDEHADLSGVPEDANELDLSGVERINSMGLLVWQSWRKKRSRPVTLRGVPVSFVLALSCVSALAEGMRIASVAAPFIDPTTGGTEEILLDAPVLAKIRATGECPSIPSTKTQHPLELDDDATQYFAFLNVAHGPTLAGDV